MSSGLSQAWILSRAPPSWRAKRVCDCSRKHQLRDRTLLFTASESLDFMPPRPTRLPSPKRVAQCCCTGSEFVSLLKDPKRRKPWSCDELQASMGLSTGAQRLPWRQTLSLLHQRAQPAFCTGGRPWSQSSSACMCGCSIVSDSSRPHGLLCP